MTKQFASSGRADQESYSFLDHGVPLTTFERFLWEADGPSHPMVFRVLMKFDGTVDRSLLQQSFDTVVARHPLLTATIDQHRGKPTWRQLAVLPTLQWDEAVRLGRNQESGDYVEPIDLTAQAGLRVRLTAADNGVLIWLDFHHASCDGMGARQLITDWFHLYDRRSRREPDALVTFESDKLRTRGAVRQRPGTEPIGFREGVRNFYVTVSGRTAHLKKIFPPAETPRVGGSFLHEYAFTGEQTTLLRAGLKSSGLSINDLGIAVSMLVFARQFSTVKPRHFITVLNPVDLRLPSDRYLSATNKTGFTYLRRRRQVCLKMTLADLLQSIREQTDYIKDRFVGAEFVHGLNGVDKWPGVLRLMQRVGWFTPSMQFTCLGDVTRGRRYGFRLEEGRIRIGELAIDRVSGFAPAAPGVPLSITACETNSRLMLSVRSSQQFVSEVQGRHFIQLLCDEMLKWAGLQPSRGVGESSE